MRLVAMAMRMGGNKEDANRMAMVTVTRVAGKHR
jgi:hypothetical protein